MEIARVQGRAIINADALQVWSCWRTLSARPTVAEEAALPHHLFGHIGPGTDYSVGHWLREVQALLACHANPVIVGGTGLYLTALTEGLADIPATPAAIREKANALLNQHGPDALIAELDDRTLARVDRQNPIRIQRAWEVLHSTGRGLADWQDGTGPALLPHGTATLLRLECDRDWLAARIEARFDLMMKAGALDEARAVLPIWNPNALWSKAIGAPELIAYLQGVMTLADAISAAKAQSRQYAKRQRTWLRKRMSHWHALPRP